jgi:hypothetical protein
MITLDSYRIKNPISLEFVQGEDVNIIVDIADAGGNTVNLLDTVIESEIRKEYNQEVIASFVVDNTDLSIGKFTLTLPSSVTETLPVRSRSRVTSFVFDIKITYQNGSVERPIHGYLKMVRGVTE